MKRVIKASLALALILGAGGCGLDEKLVSNLGPSYVSTAQGLTDATNAMYTSLRSYGSGDTYYTIEQLGTDTWLAGDQISAGGAQNWFYFQTYDPQYTTTAGFVGPAWNSMYTLISRANLVLDNGPNTPVGGTLTQAVKDSRLGEAHFMRALAYFNLIQQFGCGSGPTCGVTINLSATSGVSTEATRESEDSTYKVIINDLNQAVTLLPSAQTDYGRATKGAAQDLLAKVYLTRAYRDWNSANKTADFQQALTLAQAVINSNLYSLVPVYANLWCGTHRAAAPTDPGRQGYCDLTNYNERPPEVIFPVTYTYDVTQYSQSAGNESNYMHLVYLSHYDANSGWATGMNRSLDDGRPFRRMRPAPAAIYLFNQTRCGATPCGPGVDVVDSRFDGSFQTVWWANFSGSNSTGTCPNCTSGAAINGIALRDASGSLIGAGAGADTSVVYLMYQVPDSYRQSKKYRIMTPCTTAPGADCGNNNDATGTFGYEHYPSLKKYQDNLRAGGLSDQNGGKDRFLLRLGETYLIAAEAAVGLGQPDVAAQMINVLRVRAACDPAATPALCTTSHKSDPSILVTPAQMTLDFIYDERERELSGELSRWDDLHRPGKDFFLARIRQYNPFAAPNIVDKHYARPIPAQQIQGVTGTPYPQNPGWQ